MANGKVKDVVCGYQPHDSNDRDACRYINNSSYGPRHRYSQVSHGKDNQKANLFRGADMKPEQEGYRSEQENEVDDHVGCRLAQEELVRVQAFAVHQWIPLGRDGLACEDGHDEHGKKPGNQDSKQNPGEDGKASTCRTKRPAVEEDNRCFDQGDGEGPKKQVKEEQQLHVFEGIPGGELKVLSKSMVGC